ncbi:hypothetical protein [Halosolutus gelatinilyticus]|uniref:hypothetical protein n=1 Tax=Halosolutus gelatinilyticus TaxID=2931975 RepID=UPI001FF1B492|nr:hypothetical protein [Halosolutus gelatinilyticus]
MTDRTPEWMEPGDEEILELMRDDDVFTPDHVAEDVALRAPDVAYRCRVLVDHGLLTKHGMGMYDITDLGEKYLDGEVEPDELPSDEE